jgi:hypothetical protein
VEVARTTGLPLKAVPLIREAQGGTEDVVREGLESNHQVGRDEIRVALDAVPDEATAGRIICKSWVHGSTGKYVMDLVISRFPSVAANRDFISSDSNVETDGAVNSMTFTISLLSKLSGKFSSLSRQRDLMQSSSDISEPISTTYKTIGLSISAWQNSQQMPYHQNRQK